MSALLSSFRVWEAWGMRIQCVHVCICWQLYYLFETVTSNGERVRAVPFGLKRVWARGSLTNSLLVNPYLTYPPWAPTFGIPQVAALRGLAALLACARGPCLWEHFHARLARLDNRWSTPSCAVAVLGVVTLAFAPKCLKGVFAGACGVWVTLQCQLLFNTKWFPATQCCNLGWLGVDFYDVTRLVYTS